MKGHSLLWYPTEKLLLHGGDERIAPDQSGRNKYGCSAGPDARVLALGSSTASSISEPAFAAADRLRRRLLAGSVERPPAELYRRESERIQGELTRLCGLADLAGLRVILAASGTDLHVIAAQRAAGADASPVRIIMMEAAETGSGVAAALSGRHFGRRTADGQDVVPGSPIGGAKENQVVQVRVRHADGSPRPQSEIGAEVEALAANAVAAGQRVLLVGLDQSKTGLLVPAPACLAELRRRWPTRLDVLIDACQFRLSNTTLRRYLDEGFLLAVTGSKFFTGPSFCGALFVPPELAVRWPREPVPPAVDDQAQIGLLLRWEAALEEMRRWSQVPEAAVRGFVDAFGAAVRARLDGDPAFERLTAPPVDRGSFSAPRAWDGLPTIFPFVLHRIRDGVRTPLSRQETGDVHRALAIPGDAAPACELGQPVACGQRGHTPVSALRLCLSARLIVEATSPMDPTRADAVILRAIMALDRLALGLHTLSPQALQHV